MQESKPLARILGSARKSLSLVALTILISLATGLYSFAAAEDTALPLDKDQQLQALKSLPQSQRDAIVNALRPEADAPLPLDKDQQLQALKNLPQSQRDAIVKALRPEAETQTTQKTHTSPAVAVKSRPLQTDERTLEWAQNGSDEVQARVTPQERSLAGQPIYPFGYDLFARAPSTFAPVQNMPVPGDYVLGPGDTIQIQLYGAANNVYRLVVNRDGMLNIPDMGPVPVAGLHFEDAKKQLEQRFSKNIIGAEVAISMGPLRSITVFVLGDVQQPGSYTVSGLATMANALLASGGIKTIGSLRDVQLKRSGKIVNRLDLYDLLLNGDTSHDSRLQPGDVIFVPPVGMTVGVVGYVRRPAIYELRGRPNINHLLQIAGGLFPTAYGPASQVERINRQGVRTLIDVDVTRKQGRHFTLHNGDILRVYSALDKMEDIVFLSGHVARPGGIQWRAGMRVSDVIGSAAQLLPQADLDYVLIKRELNDGERIDVLSTQLRKVLAHPGGDADILLQNRDEIYVFPLDGDERETIISPILTQLMNRSDPGGAKIVGISGQIRFPGRYPMETGMRISDLVRAGGGFEESAYLLEAELTRHAISNGRFRDTEHVKIDLPKAMLGDKEFDMQLHPHDVLTIRELPNWSQGDQIEIRGEVRFPGAYPISKGETLSQVLRRAGSLSDLADPKAAVFTRESLRIKEQEKLNTLADRLELQITTDSLERESGKNRDNDSNLLARTLVQNIRSTKAVGRLVIDLPAIMAGQLNADVILENGDKIYIPSHRQEVTVIGEVYHPTSHLAQKKYTRDDYINLSGGLTTRADSKRIYVIRANGAIVASAADGRFGFSKNRKIEAGDTIVVPLNVDRLQRLTTISTISQIVYQLGVAAAAWNAVGLF